MSGSVRAGTANSASAGSFADQRTRVSDPASFTRAESGFRTMDKILANDKLTRGEMLEMLQTEFNDVQINDSYKSCCN